MIRGKFLTSLDDISQIFELRRGIFCDEMGFPAEGEPDDNDKMAVYALAYAEDGTPIATGRMYIADDRFNIGRVCVLKPLRGMQIGDFIMRMLLYRAQDLNAGSVTMQAPASLVKYFSRYGFRPQGEAFEVNGIPSRTLYVAGDKIDIEGSCSCHKNASGCSGDCAGCAGCEEGEKI